MAAHPSPSRPDAIRRHNLAVLLSHLHRDGALTRAQLTQRLGVSRSTVGALVADLSALGLVEEFVPTGGAGVGRPSHTVAPHPGGPFAVAVDVDITSVTVAAVGLGGTVLSRETRGVDEYGGRPGGVAELLGDVVPRLRPDDCPSAMPIGIGISVPGTVDHRTGNIGVAPNLGWHDVALARLIDQHLPAVPVAVGNDADLAVRAEHRRGSGRDCDDVVYLMGRVGVGAGIVIGGQPLHGHDGHAGEIGHNVLDVTGPLCHCGKRGCVETFVGGAALLHRAGRDQQVTPAAVDAVFADARAGVVPALDAVRAVAEPLGRTIADLLNTLNPQRVLLGGSFGELLELARPELESAIERYALEAQHRSAALLAPAFGDDSALLGAAEIAFDALLADPLLVAQPA